MKTITRLFEKKDRTLAIGIFNGGSVIGATLAPPVIVYLLQHYGFRIAFLVPTLAGLWIPLWWPLPPRAEANGQAPARGFNAADARQLLFLGRDAVPLLRRPGHAVLLVLDAELSLQCAAHVDDGDRHAGVDSLPDGDTGGVLGGWFAGVLLRRGVTVQNTRRILMYGSACCAGRFCGAVHARILPGLTCLPLLWPPIILFPRTCLPR